MKQRQALACGCGFALRGAGHDGGPLAVKPRGQELDETMHAEAVVDLRQEDTGGDAADGGEGRVGVGKGWRRLSHSVGVSCG
jgi:hypothetical protein